MPLFFLFVLIAANLSVDVGAGVKPPTCLEAARAARARILRAKVARQRQTFWLELSRGELHCGAVPDGDFLKLASRLKNKTPQETQGELRSWLEGGYQTRELEQICPDARRKLEEALQLPLKDAQTLHLIGACHSFEAEWREFREVDPVTFLTAQVLRHHWKKNGILTEAHIDILKLYLHAVAHE